MNECQECLAEVAGEYPLCDVCEALERQTEAQRWARADYVEKGNSSYDMLMICFAINLAAVKIERVLRAANE